MRGIIIFLVICLASCSQEKEKYPVEIGLNCDLFANPEWNKRYVFDLSAGNLKEEIKFRYDKDISVDELLQIFCNPVVEVNGSVTLIVTSNPGVSDSTRFYINKVIMDKNRELRPIYQEHGIQINAMIDQAYEQMRRVDQGDWDEFKSNFRLDVLALLKKGDWEAIMAERQSKGVQSGIRDYQKSKIAMIDGQIEMIEVCFIDRRDHRRQECLVYAIDSEGNSQIVGFHQL